MNVNDISTSSSDESHYSYFRMNMLKISYIVIIIDLLIENNVMQS
jgi:hypothetical protein